VIQGTGATGFDAAVPGAPSFDIAETNSQLEIGDLAIAGAPANTDGIDFASFILYYVDESAGTALGLTAGLTSGATSMSASGALPASAPTPVTFTFYNTTHGSVTIGPGYVHSIGIGAATYEYEQLVGDTGATIATALANLINAEADPNALATAAGSTVTLTALQNTAVGVTCSASDGNTPATLTETEPSYVVIDEEIIQVESSSGATIVRGALGSTPAAHSSGAKIWPVSAMTVVFALPQFAYGTPLWPTVIGQIPWGSKSLVAATCWVANEIGPSPMTTECFTGAGPFAVDSLGNPLAPDVAAFTASVTTGISVGGLPFYQFSGTVETGLAPTGTAEIDVVMTDASGIATVVYQFMAPFTASTVLNWKSVLFAQPTSGSGLTFTPTVVPLNGDAAPTVSAHTVGPLTVGVGTSSVGAPGTPENPYSVTLTEVGPRTFKLSDQTTYTTLAFVVEEAIVPSGSLVLGTQLHLQISSDGGVTWGDAGAGVYASDRVDEDGTHTYFVTTVNIAGFLVGTAATSYKARAWSLSQYVDNGPAAAVVSAACPVAAIGAPSATGATITLGAVVQYTDPSTGNLVWQQSITVQTPGTADPDAWAYQVTCEQTNASGAPASLIADYNSVGMSGAAFGQPECPFVDFANDGKTHVNTLIASYAPSGSTFTYVRWKVYGFSRSATVATPVNCWQDPTYSVLQQWPGGATSDISNFGPLPGASLDFRRVRPLTLGGGLTTDSSNRPTVQVAGSQTLADGGFESGLTGWTCTGNWAASSVTPHSGSGCAVCVPSSGALGGRAWQQFTAVAGQLWAVNAWQRYAGGTPNCTPACFIEFYNAGGTLLGSAAYSWTTRSGTWAVLAAASATAPAGTAYVYVGVCLDGYDGGGSSYYFDDVVVTFPGASVGGLVIDGSGNVGANLGYTMQINGSNQLVLANLPCVAGLPALPSATYPAGSVVCDTLSGTDPSTGLATPAYTLYRNPTGSQWVASQTPADLVAGAIATGVSIAAAQITAGTLVAGVVYAGAIACSQLQAGTISVSISLTSPTIIVTAGGVTTTIGPSALASGYGTAAYGVEVANSTVNVGMVATGGSYPGGTIAILNAAGTQALAVMAYSTLIGHGVVVLQDPTMTHVAYLSPSELQITDLPSTNPGAGSKQFWYDPSDGNRVKFAA
jgi:hypothetical protein